MTKTLTILSVLLFAFACKKADNQALEVKNLKEISSQPVTPFSIASKVTITSTASDINDLVALNSSLILVGNFTSLGPASSKCIASYTTSLQSFGSNIGSGSNVRTIDYFNNKYIIGGYFNTTSSSTYRGLGTLSGGIVTPFSLITGQVYNLYSGNQSFCYAAGTVSMANSYSTSAGRVNTSFGLLGSYYGTLSSFSPTVYATAYFDNVLFMGGSLSSTYEKNIVYSSGGSWQKAGNGFNSTVNDLLVFNGKMYAAGNMSLDGNNSTAMNYVNQLSQAGSNWSKAGSNNLPSYCTCLAIHKGQLVACGSAGNQGYIYKLNSTDNVWETCLNSGVSLKSMLKIESFNNSLYGLEKDLSTGQTSFIRLD